MRPPRLTKQHSERKPPVVRVVQQRDDPFANLKGHAYIKARSLSRPIQRVQTSAHPAEQMDGGKQ